MSYQWMDRPNESNALSLVDSMTLKIAIPLWMHHLSLYDPNTVDYALLDEDPDDIFLFFEPIDVRKSIILPSTLEEKLINCLAELKKETNLWMFHHNGKFFPKKSRIYILPCLKNLVWRFDGSIDYDGTARKLVQDEYLQEFDRVVIAETFVLLDYLRKYFTTYSDERLKRGIYPESVLAMITYYGECAPWDQMSKFHERSERFLRWYFDDQRQIDDFKRSATDRFIKNCDEDRDDRIRIILYGFGDDGHRPK